MTAKRGVARWVAAAAVAVAVLGPAVPIASAAPFTVNAGRFDPYKNFKFRVMWDGRYVAEVSSISPLVRRTEVIQYRSGGDPSITHKSPGRTNFDAITLGRGVTHDTAFEDWADKTWHYGASPGTEVALGSLRKDVRIEFYNEAGQLVIAYNVYRCWVAEYQALPALDANAADTAFESITLQCEGWARDKAVVEPAEPH